jgi:SAM-dependent methyltransferase
MLKQWSLESVHYSHGYQNIEKSDPDVHVNFSNWLDINYGDKKIKIVDIGGGNGRVCLSINKNIEEYYCLDLNQENIRAGQNFFKDDKRIKFINFDIDNQELDIECDVVYIDSVLTMVEEPFKDLLKLSKISNFIFINRTIFYENTIKSGNLWGGMKEPSTLWTFDYQTMLDFCSNNNLELIIISESSFVIKKN